jgi:pimeloyl-ACP methyl ester carboxylesterase
VSARRVLLCLPSGAPFADPAPDETAKRDVELVAQLDGMPAGVVGSEMGGFAALRLAAEHRDLVDRLVLVSVPAPEGEPAGVDLDSIAAKTLLLFGRERELGYANGKWWRDRLGARLEIVPGQADDLLPRVWSRVLSHLAPHTKRRG